MIKREKRDGEGFEFHERTMGFAKQPIAANKSVAASFQGLVVEGDNAMFDSMN